MPVSYRCAYCGSQQTWSGSGPQVCDHCGATQKARDVSGMNGAGPALRRKVGLIMLVLLVAIGLAMYWLSQSHKSHQQSATAPVLHSRILNVKTPTVREVPPGSDLSAMDLLKSAPANAANLFDTKLLVVSMPRPMKDTEGTLYYVGEVVNRSPDHTAMAPTLQLGIVKNRRVVETSDLSFSDLPPGGHSPAYFSWNGDPHDIDTMEFHWKPVQGYLASSPKHPRLEAVIMARKMTPASVTVNFSYTYHYVSADVEGIVTNRGDAVASGVQLYLTLRDASGHVTGFKEKDLDPVAPGEATHFTISADQWGNPVASMDVQAVAVSPSTL